MFNGMSDDIQIWFCTSTYHKYIYPPFVKLTLCSDSHHHYMLSELQNRIHEHPEELLPVFRDFQESYEMVKRLRNVDMKVAITTLDALLHKVHCLQRIPIESVPISAELWSTHLSRIYNNCQKEKHNIQEAFARWSVLEPSATQHDRLPELHTDRLLLPWISDWNDDTLQTDTIKRLVRDVVVPILYPESILTPTQTGARAHTLLVNGPSNVGKSFAVRSIRTYLRKYNHPVQWVDLSAYDCASYAKRTLDEARASGGGASAKLHPHEWTILVTDGVPAKTMKQWVGEEWCVAWDRHLRRSPNTLWIVLVTTAPHEPEPTHVRYDNISPIQYTFELPDSKVVYHYLKKRIFQHYSSADLDNGKPFPDFANLPIVEKLPELAQFVVKYVKQYHPDFEHVEQLFYSAVQYCEECSLNNNGLFGIQVAYKSLLPTADTPESSQTATRLVTRWYPKDSITLATLPDVYEYKLLNHSKHDCMEWCPQTANGDHDKCTGKKVTFWNTQLFDTLPFCENDRFTHIYIDPSSMSPDQQAYSIIATFPIQTNVFPYHLKQDLEQCYEWAVSFGCGISNYTRHAHLAESVPSGLGVGSGSGSEPEYIRSTADVQSLTDGQCAEVYKHIYPHKLHCSNVRSASQVWTIERKEMQAVPHPETHCFNLSYKGNHSTRIAEFVNGVPYNVSADALQKLIAVLLDSNTHQPCNVVQVQTHGGYAYYIDFSDELEQSFRLTNVDNLCIVAILPQIALPTLESGFELDEHYRMTTESDANALIEKFPRDYKDVYVDDEATWKLKPLRKPEHAAFLNDKYTKKQKCYLKLFSDLLRAKVAHYACLTSSQRMQLDATLMDLQNLLDYVLHIIPETDHTGKWNEVWSMNRDHPEYEQYHPPEHDEVDKVISVKLATEWLRHDAAFTVSPVWLKTVGVLCGLYNDDSNPLGKNRHNNNHNQAGGATLCDITRTWKIYLRQSDVVNTEWVYLKSTVSHTFWEHAQDTSRLFAHMQSELQQKHIDFAKMNQCDQQMQKHSLFFEVFRNVEQIGYHQKDSSRVHWNTFASFSQDDPIHPTLKALNAEPKIWLLLFKHYPPVYSHWLCSLYHTSGHRTTTYAHLYAHLLYPPAIHYWSLAAHGSGESTLFGDIQNQSNLDTFVRHYAFIHNQLHKKQFVLTGELPGTYVREAVVANDTVSMLPTLSKKEKQVMTTEDKSRIHLYGLDLHHLTDILNRSI